MTRPRVRTLLLLAACFMVVGLMVFAAACGESGETTATTGAEITATTSAETVTTAAETTATSGTMAVEGLVDSPKTLTVADLEAMNVTTITAEHPKKGLTEYKGVLLSELMTAVGVQSGATVLDMGCTDGYMAEVTLAELDENAMVAIDDDGKLNAVMPGMTGKAWASDIVSMEFK